MARAVAGALILSLAITSARAAEPPPLPANEAAWFARWNLPPGNDASLGRSFVEQRKARMARSRISSRLPEALAAERSGDVVAGYLIALELDRRCIGGQQPDPSACAALFDWVHEPNTSRSKPVSAATARFQMWDPNHDGEIYARLYDIGSILEVGVGGRADMRRAVGFYKWAIDAQDDHQRREANYRMGRLTESGKLGAADPALARKYYEAAAYHGHGMAAYLLANMILKSGGPQAQQKAAAYFAVAAGAGVADAAFRYARMLETGQAQTYKASRKIYLNYRIGAAKGHAPSISGVARSYANGWGVPRDAAQAEAWWKTASDAGDPEAAWEVANLNARRGDHAGGLPYLRRAAAGGFPGARDLLANWQAAGVRERSLGNSLLSVLEFIGEVGAAYQEQRSRELAAQEAYWAGAVRYMADHSSTAGSSSASTSSEWTASDTSGSSGQLSAGGASSAQGGDESSVNSDGSSAASGYAQSSESSTMAGSSTSAEASASRKSGSSSSSSAASSRSGDASTAGMYLTISDGGAAQAAARQAALQAAQDRQQRVAEAEGKARIAQMNADAAADRAKFEAMARERWSRCGATTCPQ